MAERRCRICDIIKGIPYDITSYVEKQYDMMSESERADEELIKERLEVCSSCEKRQDSTCLKCGCYIQIRVLSRHSRCPARKW